MKDFPEFEDFQDFRGNQVRFKYVPFNAGHIFSLRAFELNNQEVQQIFSSYDEHSLLNCLIKIRETIRSELNIRYFKETPDDTFGSMNFDYFRGSIACDTNDNVCIVVDGKKMDITDFKRILDAHEGWRLEVRISEE